jgi:hypothetical protein
VSVVSTAGTFNKNIKKGYVLDDAEFGSGRAKFVLFSKIYRPSLWPTRVPGLFPGSKAAGA